MSDLMIHDCTTWARLGIRGNRLERWLDTTAYRAPSAVNTAHMQDDGTLIARLSPGELLWLAGTENDLGPLDLPEEDFNCYTVSRQDSHCWFQLKGIDLANVMATVCGVNLDLSVFPPLSVAQTQLARISAIVIRQPADAECVSILADRSYSAYLLDVLQDSIRP